MFGDGLKSLSFSVYLYKKKKKYTKSKAIEAKNELEKKD